jgi:hypothetical protein
VGFAHDAFGRLSPSLQHRHVDEIRQEWKVIAAGQLRQPARLDGDMLGSRRPGGKLRSFVNNEASSNNAEFM